MSDEQDRVALTEKLRAQAETGGGRTAARPATLSDAGGSTGLSGMSGQVTNDSMPQGGATGDRTLPDTVDAGAPAKAGDGA